MVDFQNAGTVLTIHSLHAHTHTHIGSRVLVHAFNGNGEDGVGAGGVLVHHGCTHGAVLVAHLR